MSKVLFVLKVPPPFGGGEIEQQYIFRFLKDKYFFVLFSRRTHNKAKQGRLLLSNVMFALNMTARIIVACLKYRPKTVFLWLPKDLPAFLRTFVLVVLLKPFRVRILGDLHGLGMDFLDKAWTRKFYCYSINQFSKIRVLGQSIAHSLKESGYKNKIAIIDNGIDVPQNVLDYKRPSHKVLQLLVLGAISESKGFYKVLYLCYQLFKKELQFHLHVVGEWVDSHFREICLRFINDNNLENYITFYGIQIDEQKWTRLKSADLMLHFTNWDGQPLTIIEAMAAGVPTISTRVGAIPEMITHSYNGFLIDDYKSEPVEIIEKIATHKIKLEDISKNAKTVFLTRFTIDKYIKNIDTFVTEE